jgi:hypothetical protein
MNSSLAHFVQAFGFPCSQAKHFNYEAQHVFLTKVVVRERLG